MKSTARAASPARWIAVVALLAAGAGNGTQAVQTAGNRDQRHRRLIFLVGHRSARQVRGGGRLALQAEGEMQAQAGHGSRPTRQPRGGKRGKDPIAEIGGGGTLLFRVERGGGDDADAGSPQLRQDLGVQRPVLQLDHRVCRGRQP